MPYTSHVWLTTPPNKCVFYCSHSLWNISNVQLMSKFWSFSTQTFPYAAASMNPIVVTPRWSARNKWKSGTAVQGNQVHCRIKLHTLKIFFRVMNKKTCKHCFVDVLKPKLHVITAPGRMAFDDSYTQAAEQGFQITFLSRDCLWTKHVTFIQSQKPFKSAQFSQYHTKGLIFSIQKVETEEWSEKGLVESVIRFEKWAICKWNTNFNLRITWHVA